MKTRQEVTTGMLHRELDAEFKRWEHIRDHGCNMNLVRNHIIYAYRQLAEPLPGWLQALVWGW